MHTEIFVDQQQPWRSGDTVTVSHCNTIDQQQEVIALLAQELDGITVLPDVYGENFNLVAILQSEFLIDAAVQQAATERVSLCADEGLNLAPQGGQKLGYVALPTGFEPVLPP